MTVYTINNVGFKYPIVKSTIRLLISLVGMRLLLSTKKKNFQPLYVSVIPLTFF